MLASHKSLPAILFYCDSNIVNLFCVCFKFIHHKYDVGIQTNMDKILISNADMTSTSWICQKTIQELLCSLVIRNRDDIAPLGGPSLFRSKFWAFKAIEICSADMFMNSQTNARVSNFVFSFWLAKIETGVFWYVHVPEI